MQLDRNDVLSAIASAGLSATELGPHGFLPEEPVELAALLSKHRLSLVSGFVPAILHRPELLDSELRRVEAQANTLAAARADVLVLAATTDRVGYEQSTSLTDEEWTTLSRGLANAESIGHALGLNVALHPHYGTVIEREADIGRLLDQTDMELCLDTGHLVIGDADPLAIARAAAQRVALVHLKDVDASMARRVRARETGYRDAVSYGLYRPLGDGDAHIADVVRVLARSDYDGWFVIEQDLVIPPGGNGDEALRNTRRSVAFLESMTNSPVSVA